MKGFRRAETRLTRIWKCDQIQVNSVIFSKSVTLSSVLTIIYFSFKSSFWGSLAFAFVKRMPQHLDLNHFPPPPLPTGWSWTSTCLVWLQVTRSSFIPQNTLPGIKDTGYDLPFTISPLYRCHHKISFSSHKSWKCWRLLSWHIFPHSVIISFNVVWTRSHQSGTLIFYLHKLLQFLDDFGSWSQRQKCILF